MAKTTTLPWDPAERLETEEDMAAYLEASLAEGEFPLVAATLGDLAHSVCASTRHQPGSRAAADLAGEVARMVLEARGGHFFGHLDSLQFLLYCRPSGYRPWENQATSFKAPSTS
jgi:hypothetical protein